MADLEDQRTPNPASLNGLSDDNLGFDDSSLGLDASHLSKFSDPHSQHPFDPYTPQPSSLMADKDYDQSGYGYSDYDDENDFARAGEPTGQGHFPSEQFGDLPANFAKEAAAKQQNFPELDNFEDESYVRGESEGRDDESVEGAVQQGSNPFAVDAGKKQTGGAYVDPHDRPIVGFNPFLNEEAGYEKEDEDEHGDVSQEDNEQYHGGPEGEPAGREYGDGREDQAEYDRLEDDEDSYHQRETAQKVEHFEDEGVGSRTDEAGEGHSEDERTEEHSEGDLHSPGEFPQGYIHSQETTAFQPEVSKTPGQDDIADFESGQYDESAYNQREQSGDTDEYPDTQPTGVNFDKGEVFEDGHRDEGSDIPQQVLQAEEDDLGIVNQGFSDDGEPEGGRVIPEEEEEITESEAPTSAIVDTELYEDRREGRAEPLIREEEGEHEEPVVHGEEKQYEDEEEQYSRSHTNGGDYVKEEINQEEDMEYAGTVQEEYKKIQPEDEDYRERQKDYGDQYRQEEEEEMEHEDYSQEEQVKPEAADVYETSPTKVDFSQINYDDDEEEEEADKTNEYLEQESVKTGEAHTSADDDYRAQYPDEEAVDDTTSTNRGDNLESYGLGYHEESYKHTGESEFTSRVAESDLLSTERSYVDNLSNVTSPETIPQPLPSPPEPRNLSSFDPLAASDSPGLPEPVGNVGQHAELFQHGFVAAESNTAPFLTAGEVEGETKFGVDGTAITSTSQNIAFLHSDEEEEEEEDEEESQHLDQGQTGTTETETSAEEKSADDYEPQHGAEHMEGNDNALMSMSMEGSFYDDGGELIGGEDRRNQTENNFFEERSIAEEGSLLDRLDPKQESSYLENHGLGQVIQGDSAVDEDRYQPQEEFDVRGSDVDLEPPIGEEVRPAFEENGVHEEEDKPGGFDSEVDILEPERVSQTQAIEHEEAADSFVDHIGLDSTANESESSVDSQHLQVHEVESPKEVEDVVSGVGVSDVSPEKPEEPAASVEETPAAGKEEPTVAAAETAAPEAAAATAAVGVAVVAAAAAATVTTKSTTTVKKSSAKAGAKTTTTTTTTKVTKETKPAAGKVTTVKKTEVTTATSKTTPRKPAESRPTTATTEKKTPARPITSPTKPASATSARSSAPAPSPAQPPAARKPKEVKPATPDEKKKPTTTTTTTPRTPSATHRTPRPQSATTSTGSASSTTATATTATTRTTRTVTSATTRTTTLAARPKSTPTKLTNGTAASTTLDTKSPAKKPGIDTKTGSARTPIEKKATPKVDTGSKSTTPAAAARSPTKTTTTPRTPATPKSAEVRSKIGSMENTTHTPGGGHVKIASKKPDFSNVTSKVGSKDKIDHKPGGGNIRIETKKVKVEAKSKVGSLNNTTHKPGGGDKKAESQKTSKVQSLEKQGPGSGSEQGAVAVQNGAASEN